jgi:SP family arabinose:H+ symporter-like MFS transporter
MDAIGESVTFLLFALACIVAFAWIKRRVPETKGKSLEEIQQAWAEHDEALAAPAPAPEVG